MKKRARDNGGSTRGSARDSIFGSSTIPVQRNDCKPESKSSYYPPETDLFTALPMLCISSPIPRIVAHPSEAKTTKNNDQRSSFFFFIFTFQCDTEQQACQAVTTVIKKRFPNRFFDCLL